MAQRKFDDTIINVEFEEVKNRQQIESGDEIKTLFGKIRKFLSDLKVIAFSGKASDLDNDVNFQTDKDIAIKSSDIGNPVHLTDSTDAPLVGLTIEGNSTQNTLSGNQLANLPDISDTTSYGLTWNCTNGVVTVKGTSKQQVSSMSFLAYSIPIGTSGSFYISGSVTGVTCYVVVKYVDGTNNWFSNNRFSLDGTEQSAILYFQVEAGVTTNVTLYPMLNAGTTALPFEPYCGGIPSPNPSYPQEIKSVGDDGSIKIVACGNQLANFPEVDSWTIDGLTWSCHNNVVTVKGTSIRTVSTGASIFATLPLGTKGTFCISGSSGDVICYVKVTHSDNSKSFYHSSSFTLDGTEKEVIAYYQVNSGVTVDIVLYPMLDFGTQPLSFESYKGSSATLTSALPLCSVGDIKDEVIYNADGTAKVIKRNRLLNMTNVTFWTPKYIEDSDYQQFNVGMTVLSKTSNIRCTHFPYNANCTNGKELGIYIFNNSQMVFGVPKVVLIEYGYIGGTDSTYLTALKAWLKSQSDIGNPVTVLYQYATPQEINLTAEETAQLKSLLTHKNITNIYNSDNAKMSVDYWRDTAISNELLSLQNSDNEIAERVETLEQYSLDETTARVEGDTQLQENIILGDNKLQAEIDDLDITRIAEGSFIHLTDSTDANLYSMSVYGKSTQKTLSGKNLIRNTATTQTVDGVTFTVNDDKTVSVNGTATKTIQFSIINGGIWLPAGRYTLNGGLLGASNTTYSLRIQKNGVYLDDAGKGITFNVTEYEKYEVVIIIRNGYTANNLVFKPMLRFSSIEDDTYEPYCGGITSPNPEYPQEVESIGDSGSLSVTACGKNLFNPKLMSYTKHYSIRDDGFVVFSNSTAYNEYPIVAMSLPYGKYTVVVEIESISGNGSVYVGDNAADWSRPIKVTRTVYLETDTVMICFSGKNGTAITARVGIYGENSSTDFEAYKDNTATITTALSLCSVGDMKDELIFNANGTAKVIKRFEKLVLNGSENWALGTTGNADIRRMMYYPQKASSVKANNTKVNGLCSHYQITTANHTYAVDMLTVGISMSTAHYIAVYDTRFNTADSLSSFKAWLTENPVTFIYELATPEEINLTADETVQLKSLLTYKNVTNLFNSDDADMSVEYWRDNNTSDKVVEVFENSELTRTILGTNMIVNNAANNSGLYELHLYGNSEQNGTPTPSSPIEIKNVGVNISGIIGGDDTTVTALPINIESSVLNIPTSTDYYQYLKDSVYGIPVDKNGTYTDENGQQWISSEFHYSKNSPIPWYDVLRTQRIVVTSSTNVSQYTPIGTYARVGVVVGSVVGGLNGLTDSNRVICNVLPTYISYTQDSLHCYMSGHTLWAFVPIAELVTQDSAGVKQWLIDKQAEFVYQLKEPTYIIYSIRQDTSGTSKQDYINKLYNQYGSFVLYGKTTQKGTPTLTTSYTLDNTIDIRQEHSATILTQIPLCSVGDVRDELIFNGDGTAKIIKRTYLVDDLVLGSTEANCSVYSATSPYSLVNAKGKCSHTNIYLYSGEDKEHYWTYDKAIRVYLPKSYNVNATDIKIVAVLQTPFEINLTVDETKSLLSLETFKNYTHIYNSNNAEMLVKYWHNEDVGSMITSMSRDFNTRLMAIENAVG